MRYKHIAMLLALALTISLAACGAQPVEQRSPAELFAQSGREYGRAPVPLSEIEMLRPDIKVLNAEMIAIRQALEESRSLTEAFENMMQAKEIIDAFDSFYVLSEFYCDWDSTDKDYRENLRFCVENYERADRWWSDITDTIEGGPYAESLLPVWRPWAEVPEQQNYDSARSAQLLEEIETLANEAEDILATATVGGKGKSMTLDACFAAQNWKEACANWLVAHGEALLDIYTELVALRGALARECYRAESFSHYIFAEKGWDYTPQMTQNMVDGIVARLLPLDDALTDAGYWERMYEEYCKAEDFIERARPVFEQMGGEMAAAFELLLENELWRSKGNVNSHGRPYANYLPSYRVALVFSPYDGDASSIMSFTHEFGHFYEYYLSMDAYSRAMDISEVHSQAMTLLFAEAYSSLYQEDALRELALVDLVDTLAYQSFNATVELAAYALPAEEISAERLLEIGRETCAHYGYGDGNRMLADYYWLLDEELFSDPFLSFGYVTSAGAAFEVWRLAQEDMAAALEAYASLTRHEGGEALLLNLEAAGLQSPFGDDWSEGAAQLLRAELFAADKAA